MTSACLSGWHARVAFRDHLRQFIVTGLDNPAPRERSRRDGIALALNRLQMRDHVKCADDGSN
jgi:hypothetical protein